MWKGDISLGVFVHEGSHISWPCDYLRGRALCRMRGREMHICWGPAMASSKHKSSVAPLQQSNPLVPVVDFDVLTLA